MVSPTNDNLETVLPHQRCTYICPVDVPPILQCPVSLLRAQPIVGVGRYAYHFPGLPARSLAPIGYSRRSRVLPGCRCIIMYSWAWTGVLRVLSCIFTASYPLFTRDCSHFIFQFCKLCPTSKSFQGGVPFP